MDKSRPAHEQLKRQLKLSLAEWIDVNSNTHQRTRPKREAILGELRQIFLRAVDERHRQTLSPAEWEAFLVEVVDEVVGIGPLEPLLSDETISEIMINGPTEIFVERHGKLERAPQAFSGVEQLNAVIERLLDGTGITVNEAEPCIDGSLPDGSRIHVIMPPLVLNGPTVTIRKKLRRFTLEEWIQLGSLTGPVAEFLEACVRARVNIVISGASSTGKTTLLSALSRAIPSAERIITIETIAELYLPEHEHWIRLLTRPPNAEGRGEVSLRTLVKNALRMRPDRLILGEARGGEALDVVQAMLTGHDGALTVLHASSPHAALERLQTLMLMSGIELPADVCRKQAASAVELIVHLGQFPDGGRRVETIAQVTGANREGFMLEDLFTFHLRGVGEGGAIAGLLEPTGAHPHFERKFASHSVRLSEGLFAHA